MGNGPIISAELVRKELHQILNFEEISNAHVLSKFLQFVTDKKLYGQEEEIKEYTIGFKALGKQSNFNPKVDAYVRIHAGRLRQVLDRYYIGRVNVDEGFFNIRNVTY